MFRTVVPDGNAKMPSSEAHRKRIAVNLWTARIVPIVLAGVVGYATYVLVALLCGM